MAGSDETAFAVELDGLAVCYQDVLMEVGVSRHKSPHKLRPDATPNQITAWTSIAVEGNQTRKVIATLLGEPGVAAIHDTNGRWDLLAELRSSSLQELANVLERLRLIKGIGATETSIHLATYR